MRGLILTAVLAAQAFAASLSVADVDGNALSPMRPSGPGGSALLRHSRLPDFKFLRAGNSAHLHGVRGKSVSCALVYVDAQMNAATVRKHLADFGYKGIPAILDSKHRVVEAAGAKVTPEAVVIGTMGKCNTRDGSTTSTPG